MTVVSVASFLQQVAHPAHDVRRLLMSMFGGRGGVVPRTATFTDLKVTQRGAGANMSVDVAEGSCLVTGTESAYQGVYHCENQGTQNVVIGAADATNARRDLIVARIKDSEYGVAVTDVFTIEAVAGTPAASPADPTVPANCIVLARVAVAAAASSITNANITDLRNNYAAVTGSSVIGNQVKAVAAGGVVPFLSTARPTKQIYEGMVGYQTDLALPVVYNGSAWIGLPAIRDLHYTGSISNGTATTATNVISQTNIGTAPFPLTMYLLGTGDSGANGAPNKLTLGFQDEGSTPLTSGGIHNSTGTEVNQTATNDRTQWTVRGQKDYAAGATMGFKLIYLVDTSNIYIGASVHVTFVPKTS